jgi:tetratricopeptide (TPR) repeat protein
VEALDAAAAALSIDPFCVEALVACGEAALSTEDHHKCAEFWRRALALNPWDAELHYRLSEVLGPELGDWAGTEKHLKRYVELEKTRTEAAH